MNHINNNVSFKGWGATPLKAVVFAVPLNNNDLGIFNEVKKIGDKDGFETLCACEKDISGCQDRIEFFRKDGLARGQFTFLQDIIQLFPNHQLTGPYEDLCRVFENQFKIIKKTHSFPERAGGNMFFTGNGKNAELLIGQDSVSINPRMKDYYTKHYGVKDFHVIPQADFHLDLFVRPLKDKKVLVCDDDLVVNELNQAVKNIEEYLSENCESKEKEQLETLKQKLAELVRDIHKQVELNNYASPFDVEKVLEEKGFEPVKVPGRIFYNINSAPNGIGIKHRLNYLNAIVHEKKDGSLTYITNKSKMNDKYGITPEIAKKINFDFESMFIKYLEPFVKKEDIHFIKGNKKTISEFLMNNNGGIHCLACEIPQKI